MNLPLCSSVWKTFNGKVSFSTPSAPAYQTFNMNTNNPNLWCATERTRYYYLDVDTKEEIDIECFWPMPVASFYTAKRKHDGRLVRLHFARIFVETLENKETYDTV